MAAHPSFYLKSFNQNERFNPEQENHDEARESYESMSRSFVQPQNILKPIENRDPSNYLPRRATKSAVIPDTPNQGTIGQDTVKRVMRVIERNADKFKDYLFPLTDEHAEKIRKSREENNEQNLQLPGVNRQDTTTLRLQPTDLLKQRYKRQFAENGTDFDIQSDSMIIPPSRGTSRQDSYETDSRIPGQRSYKKEREASVDDENPTWVSTPIRWYKKGVNNMKKALGNEGAPEKSIFGENAERETPQTPFTKFMNQFRADVGDPDLLKRPTVLRQGRREVNDKLNREMLSPYSTYYEVCSLHLKKRMEMVAIVWLLLITFTAFFFSSGDLFRTIGYVVHPGLFRGIGMMFSALAWTLSMLMKFISFQWFGVSFFTGSVNLLVFVIQFIISTISLAAENTLLNYKTYLGGLVYLSLLGLLTTHKKILTRKRRSALESKLVSVDEDEHDGVNVAIGMITLFHILSGVLVTWSYFHWIQSCYFTETCKRLNIEGSHQIILMYGTAWGLYRAWRFIQKKEYLPVYFESDASLYITEQLNLTVALMTRWENYVAPISWILLCKLVDGNQSLFTILKVNGVLSLQLIFSTFLLRVLWQYEIVLFNFICGRAMNISKNAQDPVSFILTGMRDKRNWLVRNLAFSEMTHRISKEPAFRHKIFNDSSNIPSSWKVLSDQCFDTFTRMQTLVKALDDVDVDDNPAETPVMPVISNQNTYKSEGKQEKSLSGNRLVQKLFMLGQQNETDENFSVASLLPGSWMVQILGTRVQKEFIQNLDACVWSFQILGNMGIAAKQEDRTFHVYNDLSHSLKQMLTTYVSLESGIKACKGGYWKSETIKRKVDKMFVSVTKLASKYRDLELNGFSSDLAMQMGRLLAEYDSSHKF